MSSGPENGVGGWGGDAMETTPAPDTPETNGVNGTQSDHEVPEGSEGPRPPPHMTQKSPSPQPEVPKVDAEACKAAGNKLYKAGKYSEAIEEYSKGLSW